MISVLGSACGVTFGRSEEGNDFFTSLDVSGEKIVGSPLTAALAYETFYPVPVDITCELRQGKDLVLEIGRAQAPAVPGDLSPDDEDERVPGNISFDWYRSPEDPKLWVGVEVFEDEAAGKAHVESEHFKQAMQEMPQWLAAVPEIIHINGESEGWGPAGEATQS